ncbi:AGAP011183-PA-like protein [Anopheles sinensis]|uniref:AGAP011183-PA-like protein n=1 Tax=Anopheles sinensis TaxID=74873 RepID=A0A084VHW5_ANOSI|nr:AGAP011183-PA-like protein [Anopheles sinensis]
MRWQTVALVALLGAAGVLGCDVPLRHYKTLGCNPIGKLSSGCPERYECPSITAHDNEKCYFNGKTYKIGDTLPGDQVAQFCQASCFCAAEKPFAKFICAQIDCPEFFRRFDHEHCMRTYKKGSCCSDGSVCGAERDNLAQCKVENEIYKEGQRFSIDKTCQSCICTADFDANVTDKNPNCYETTCGFELYSGRKVYGGGVPVYYKEERCCPSQWRLPKESDKVIQGSSAVSNDPNLQCKYGKLTLNVGDKLEIQQEDEEYQKTSCTCSVPPLLHCIQD